MIAIRDSHAPQARKPSVSTRVRPGWSKMLLFAAAVSTATLAQELPSLAKHPPYIEEASVFVPKRAGSWKLQKSQVFDDVRFGMQARYVSRDFPHIHGDVFVYPVGLGPVDEVLGAGADSFASDIVAAEKAGQYLITTMPTTQAFEVDRGDVQEPLRGRRVSYEFTQGGHTVASRAVLIYRYLHYYKLRVSGPRDDAARVDAATDELIKRVLMAVRVANRGSCAVNGDIAVRRVANMPADADPVALDGGEITITDDTPQEEVARRMVLSFSRRLDVGCHSDPRDKRYKAKRGEQMEVLRYPAGFWQSQPGESQ